jgi:GTP-binding protein
MIESYLKGRSNLIGVLHLVDVRHKPTEDDKIMNSWLREMDMPHVLIATKIDKISRGKYGQHAKVVRDTLGTEPLLFSAETRQGRDQVLSLIQQFMS